MSMRLRFVLWTVVTTVLALGFVLLSRAETLLGVGLVVASFIAVGQAMFGPIAATTVLANWFVARRGTAIGVAAMGTTAAGAVMPLITVALIDGLGWRTTLLCFAAAAVAIVVPVVLGLVVKKPEDVGQWPDGAPPEPDAPAPGPPPNVGFASLARNPQFWVLGGIFGLIGLNGVGKTTLIKTILDLNRADAGSIPEVFGS